MIKLVFGFLVSALLTVAGCGHGVLDSRDPATGPRLEEEASGLRLQAEGAPPGSVLAVSVSCGHDIYAGRAPFIERGAAGTVADIPTGALPIGPCRVEGWIEDELGVPLEECAPAAADVEVVAGEVRAVWLEILCAVAEPGSVNVVGEVRDLDTVGLPELPPEDCEDGCSPSKWVAQCGTIDVRFSVTRNNPAPYELTLEVADPALAARVAITPLGDDRFRIVTLAAGAEADGYMIGLVARLTQLGHTTEQLFHIMSYPPAEGPLDCAECVEADARPGDVEAFSSAGEPAPLCRSDARGVLGIESRRPLAEGQWVTCSLPLPEPLDLKALLGDEPAQSLGVEFCVDAEADGVVPVTLYVGEYPERSYVRLMLRHGCQKLELTAADFEPDPQATGALEWANLTRLELALEWAPLAHPVRVWMTRLAARCCDAGEVLGCDLECTSPAPPRR